VVPARYGTVLVGVILPKLLRQENDVVRKPVRRKRKDAAHT
jgi:hypothetical protein